MMQAPQPSDVAARVSSETLASKHSNRCTDDQVRASSTLVEQPKQHDAMDTTDAEPGQQGHPGAVESAGDGVEEWIDRTNEPLGEIGNGYELTSTLQTLCLTNNRLKKIERLEPCANLTELILRQNSITTVEGLDTLHNLVDIDLYMNAITDVPSSSFSHNPKLKRLDLSFNQLRNLDQFPSANLQNLEELYLIGNKIRRITALHDMPNLVMMEFGDNRIREIENLENLTSLQGLWLGRNKITTIRNLEALVDLRKLSLQSNRITAIEGLSHLSRLEELYLSHNGLKSMRGVEDLHSLQLLDLGSNSIEHIEGLDQLTFLTEFWFNNNQLASFDDLECLKDAAVIETVYLEGNPVARDAQYRKKALLALPESLEQLDAMLVVDVRRELEREDAASAGAGAGASANVNVNAIASVINEAICPSHEDVASRGVANGDAVREEDGNR